MHDAIQEVEMSELEHLWNQYIKKVHHQAMYEFVAKVKPFCKAHGLRFVSKDEGCWVILPESGPWKYSEEDADEWEDIAHGILKIVPGMNCRLCSLMPDYNPRG